MDRTEPYDTSPPVVDVDVDDDVDDAVDTTSAERVEGRRHMNRPRARRHPRVAAPQTHPLFDDRWSVVRDLLFEEYAAMDVVSTTVSHVDLVNDTVPPPGMTVHVVHNAQVRAVCRAFRVYFDAKSSERVWRDVSAETMVVHGTFRRSD